MSDFTMIVRASTGSQTFRNVNSFVGEDASGSFGIMAGHARAMTYLPAGLARFRTRDDHLHYVAVPGALLYFNREELMLTARRYLIGDDYASISDELEKQLLLEDQALQAIRRSLREMERQLLIQLSEAGRRGLR
jgi:F-type H+-transporting ATPase subunit epsilon